MKTNKLLASVVVLQGLILIGQWSGGTSILSTAQAQVPDPANRQMQMIDELKTLNVTANCILPSCSAIATARLSESEGDAINDHRQNCDHQA